MANPASSNGDQDAFLENLLWAAPEVIKDSDFMFMTDIDRVQKRVNPVHIIFPENRLK